MGRVLQYLKKLRLFKDLDEDTLSRFSEYFKEKNYAKDSIIMFLGEVGENFYIIKDGIAKVCVQSEDGREKILALLGPGECFGEMSILDRKTASANVIAHEDLDLFYIYKDDFLYFLRTNEEFMFNIIKVLTERLREADREIESMTFKGSLERLMDLLINFAMENGVAKDDGVCISKQYTHSHLADLLGVSRETVSRNLAKLREDGYIRLDEELRIVIKYRRS
jgi:CRP-like cAMP-binding protein